MGYLLAFMTIALWSVNIVLAKDFAADILPLQISLGRWVVAFLTLLPFTLFNIIKKRAIIAKHIPFLIVLALLGVVFSNTLIYKAAQTTIPINIGLLQITFPLFLTALSVMFLKKHLNFKQLLGMIIAVFGVLIVLVRGNFNTFSQIQIHIGDGYMILNTFLFALYSFLQVKRPKQLSQPTLLTLTAFIGVIILWPATYFWEGLPTFSQTNFELFFYLGVFNSVIAFLFWNMAIDKIGPIKSGMFFYLMPFLTATFAFILFGEKIVMFEVLGGVLIISGMFLLNLNNKAPQNDSR